MNLFYVVSQKIEIHAKIISTIKLLTRSGWITIARRSRTTRFRKCDWYVRFGFLLRYYWFELSFTQMHKYSELGQISDIFQFSKKKCTFIHLITNTIQWPCHWTHPDDKRTTEILDLIEYIYHHFWKYSLGTISIRRLHDSPTSQLHLFQLNESRKNPKNSVLIVPN